MTEPITGHVAKFAAEAGADALKTTNGLLVRALGPSADVIGQWLKDKTEYRLANVARIAEASARKGSADKSGTVPPRLAHQVLEDGSFWDDELAAEYYGGVLAASKTPDGRYDVGVSWTSLISSMSTAQLRAHFVLYREFARELTKRAYFNTGVPDGAKRAAMWVELNDIAVVIDPIGRHFDTLTHALIGLKRLELVGKMGWRTNLQENDEGRYTGCDYEKCLYVEPSGGGFELYGWAQGAGSLNHTTFSNGARVFDTTPSTPPLKTSMFPHLRIADDNS